MMQQKVEVMNFNRERKEVELKDFSIGLSCHTCGSVDCILRIDACRTPAYNDFLCSLVCKNCGSIEVIDA